MRVTTRRLIQGPQNGPGRPPVYSNSPLTIDSSEVAVIISDMWDTHWCRQKTGNSATDRVAELAVPINELLKKLRKEFKDICIIHCPSNVREKAYGPKSSRNDITDGERQAYQNMQEFLNHFKEAVFPYEGKVPELTIRQEVDPKGIECDCSPYPEKKCTAVFEHNSKPKEIWTRQIKSIVIEGSDYIASIDDGSRDNSVISFMQNRKKPIKYALMVGVHTNFCILTRSFGMKNLLKAGITPILLRDLTDGMIPREQPPFKDHFSGLEDVFYFIESYQTTDGELHCYTALSADIYKEEKKNVKRSIGCEEFRFKYDHRLCKDPNMPLENFDREKGFSTDGRKDYQIHRYTLPSSIVFRTSYGKIRYLNFEYDYKRTTERDSRYQRYDLEFGEYIKEVQILMNKSKRYGKYFINKLWFITNMKKGYTVGFVDDDDELEFPSNNIYKIKAHEGYAITFLQSLEEAVSGEEKALSYIQFYSQQLQQFQVKVGDDEIITPVIEYYNHEGKPCNLFFMNGQYLCCNTSHYPICVDKVACIDYVMGEPQRGKNLSAKITGVGFEIIGEGNHFVNEINCLNLFEESQTITRYFKEDKKEN